MIPSTPRTAPIGRSAAPQRALIQLHAAKVVVAVDPTPPAPPPVPKDQTILSPAMMNALVIIQAIGLAGATTTGILARKRRVELEKVTSKLREMNVELRTRMEQVRVQSCCSLIIASYLSAALRVRLSIDRRSIGVSIA